MRPGTSTHDRSLFSAVIGSASMSRRNGNRWPGLRRRRPFRDDTRLEMMLKKAPSPYCDRSRRDQINAATAHSRVLYVKQTVPIEKRFSLHVRIELNLY